MEHMQSSGRSGDLSPVTHHVPARRRTQITTRWATASMRDPRFMMWWLTGSARLGCLVFFVATGCSGGYRAEEERLRADNLRHRDEQMRQYETETTRIRAALLERFDKNRDGSLSREEEGDYRGYMAKVRSGEVANPFDGVKATGESPR